MLHFRACPLVCTETHYFLFWGLSQFCTLNVAIFCRWLVRMCVSIYVLDRTGLTVGEEKHVHHHPMTLRSLLVSPAVIVLKAKLLTRGPFFSR
jgi:hypothetical protein